MTSHQTISARQQRILDEEAAIQAGRDGLLCGVCDWRLSYYSTCLRALENIAMFKPQPLEPALQLQLESARKRMAARVRVLAQKEQLTIYPIAPAAPAVTGSACKREAVPTTSDPMIERTEYLSGGKTELLTMAEALREYCEEDLTAAGSIVAQNEAETSWKAGKTLETWVANYRPIIPTEIGKAA